MNDLEELDGGELPKELRSRVSGLAEWVDSVFEDLDVLEQILGNRWPSAMVREGFRKHHETWTDLPGFVRQFRRELSPYGGVEALESWISISENRSIRIRKPEEVVHLWPSLPGTGMTPVLFGGLLGVAQSIRPSSEDSGFAEFAVERWRNVDALPPLELRPADDENWIRADVVVLSGTDETVRQLRRRLTDERLDRGTRLSPYGHRVSLGVVPDAEVQMSSIADALADDVVLWNQMGCFSVRGVLVEGTDERCREFCRLLGERIASRERALDAVPETNEDGPPGLFARRLQARQVAEFESRRFGEGFGWAEYRVEPFDGEWVSLHTVTCHAVENPGEIPEIVDIEPWHLQGAACPAVDGASVWRDRLAEMGVTRIASPGTLQSPSLEWLHDGRSNIGDWIRATIAE